MSLNPFVFAEAIASVSLSHRPKCSCLTCRAARGDQEALLELWTEIEERYEGRAT